jgi:multidrug efflux pump subunit AcrA (membrane-fusion protein)
VTVNLKSTALGLMVAMCAAGAFGYYRWSVRETRAPLDLLAVAHAEGTRSVAAYRCAMHPSYRSDKPGVCPVCNMTLEPVYDDDAATPHSSPDSGIVRISPEKQQLIGVEYGTAEYGPVSKAIRAAAKVEADESRTIRVQSKLGGWIDDIYVTVIGSFVHKDQLLLTVYNPESQSVQSDLIKHAPGGMRMAAAAPAASARGESWATDGGQRPAVSVAAPVDPSGPALFASDAFKLELMGFDERIVMMIAKSGVPLNKVPVYSPADGFVIERTAFLKQRMTPDPLYTIADLATVFVTADVFEYEVGAVRVGDAVTFTMPYVAGKAFLGHVASIFPIADPTSHTVKVRARFNNPGYSLKPEMYGDLTIAIAEARRLTVPQEAVLDTGLKRIVFVGRGDGYLEAKEVVTGQQFGDRVEVLEGLEAGQRIVTSGNFLIDSESQLRANRGVH